MQNDKYTKIVRRQKNMSPAIIPEKAIILHTLEDTGILIKYWKCHLMDFFPGQSDISGIILDNKYRGISMEIIYLIT
jgi:hypothetical protein